MCPKGKSLSRMRPLDKDLLGRSPLTYFQTYALQPKPIHLPSRIFPSFQCLYYPAFLLLPGHSLQSDYTTSGATSGLSLQKERVCTLSPESSLYATRQTQQPPGVGFRST